LEWTGKVLNITKDWESNQYQITFSVNEASAMNRIGEIRNCEVLSIEATDYEKEKKNEQHSGRAMRMLWACLSDIAKAMRPPVDKWEVYLLMLKRYGKFTYICVKPNVVDAVKAQWRESEVIGEVDINGQKAVQMLCYFGCSTYDSKEFNILLDGVISEMKEMGLLPPPSRVMQKALDEWDKICQGRK
jgi:hypothetical protein